MAITVQGVRGATGANGAGTVTCPSFTSTAGSTIVVVTAHFGTWAGAGFTNGDVTDSKGNSYTLITDPGSTNPSLSIHYNIGGTRGATHTVTNNPVNGGAGTMNIAVIEFTATGAITFDSTTKAQGADNTAPLSVTAAAAIAGTQIAIMAGTNNSGDNPATWTNPTGYTDIYEEVNGAANLVSGAWYKVGETGTPTVGPTGGGTMSAGWVALATFKEAPVGITRLGAVTKRNNGSNNDGFTSSAVDTTGANFIVVAYGAATATAQTLSDSKGNTWTPLTAAVHSSGNQQVRLYYAYNAIVGTGHTFTITGTSNFPDLCIAWYSGVQSASDPFDVQDGDEFTGTSSATGPVTPSVNNSLVISAFCNWNGGVTVSGGSLAKITEETNFASGMSPTAMAEVIQTTAGAVTATWGSTNFVFGAMAIASFKPASGPATVQATAAGAWGGWTATATATPSTTTITYVGGTLARNGGIDSNGFTSAAFDTTGANFLLVSYSSGDTSSQTLTDSKGNTWIPMTASIGTGVRQHRFYYAYNAIVGTGHTFTITGTATYPSLAIAWYSGVQSTSDPLDQQARNGQVAPSVTAGPITPSVNGCLIATGFHHADGSNTRTLTGGCTMILDETSTVFGCDNSSYGHSVSQTTAATISANWTTTNVVLTESTIASFKPAPAGGAPAPSTLLILPRPILFRM